MDGYGLVLFLHLCALLGAIGMAAGRDHRRSPGGVRNRAQQAHLEIRSVRRILDNQRQEETNSIQRDRDGEVDGRDPPDSSARHRASDGAVSRA